MRASFTALSIVLAMTTTCAAGDWYVDNVAGDDRKNGSQPTSNSEADGPVVRQDLDAQDLVREPVDDGLHQPALLTPGARLAAGELGLDIYGMREKLKQKGLVYRPADSAG